MDSVAANRGPDSMVVGYDVKDRTRRAGSNAWCVVRWEIDLVEDSKV